jgi:hypothetical protein
VELIVTLDKKCLVLEDQTFNDSYVVRWNSAICGQANRLEPEFTLTLRRPNMHMGRFIHLVGVKVKSEPADSKDRRHSWLD